MVLELHMKIRDRLDRQLCKVKAERGQAQGPPIDRGVEQAV